MVAADGMYCDSCAVYRFHRTLPVCELDNVGGAAVLAPAVNHIAWNQNKVTAVVYNRPCNSPYNEIVDTGFATGVIISIVAPGVTEDREFPLSCFGFS
uniref:Uncharacterized protein n=1 Tax=Candidatus Methanogaster sp. ANME-2c ERB4 TaxID=2759911 RepID=A0A7G9YQF3_9EURY|nr:hypothetical protein LCEAEILH_00003 [Methanosarcinales archaeon ANME-2c ERB4]